MKHYFTSANGIGYDNTGNHGEILNAHISYKGRSIIVDYEFYLHCYDHVRSKEDTAVPFEMYPYGDDIFVGYVPLDDKFKKADMGKLIEIVEEALQNEPEPYDYNKDETNED